MRKVTAQQAAPRNFLQSQVQNVVIPAPTSGWNAIDPIALMEPKFAPVLDNWVPRPGWIEIRPGYSAWAQNIANSTSTPVESLMTYRPPTSERLLAAAGNTIYEVTSQGITTVQQTGLLNARWQYINYTVAGSSSYIYMVNGQDNPRYFDGSTWTQAAITGATMSITSFNNIASWKRRIWFVPNNSTQVVWMPVDAITGPIQGQLDLGALMDKGGHIVAIGKVNVNGGNGPDDLIVFISSRGQCMVYQGTDPTQITAFGLVSTFDMPPPLGARCTMGYGADLALITLQGIIPLSQAMPLDSDAVRGVALTKNIQEAMRLSAQMSQNNFGWELSHFPLQGVFLLNVPLNTNQSQVQYVQNTETGAWCRFTGWNANCFTLFNDQLYFGDNKGNVNQAWVGPADLVTAISSDMQCAFNYFGDPGKIKKMTQVQPLLQTSGTVIPTLAVNVDFANTSPAALVQSINPTGAQFGTAIFGTSTFGGGLVTQGLWQATEGQGHALALRMKVNLLPAGAGGQSVFDTGTFDAMVFDDFGNQTSTLQVYAFNSLVIFGGVI